MNLLLVEDETRLSGYLERILREDGYATSHCATIEEIEALLATRHFVPDLVLLDRLLHQKDAITLVPDIRRVFPRSRILILSAVDTASEKATALDAGADDYLAKPFASVELLARLRVLARRVGESEAAAYSSVGNVILDPIAHTVFVDGQRVQLSHKEFSVLRLLMKQPGRVYPKREIFEIIWELRPETESNVVEATINNLRRKLEGANANPVIRNMRNTGYWIEA